MAQCLAEFQKQHTALQTMYRDGVRNRRIDANEARKVDEIETRVNKLQDDFKKPGVTQAQCDAGMKVLVEERSQLQDSLKPSRGTRER